MYRFAGVRRRVAVALQSSGCCEPTCGPETCGTSASEMRARKADQVREEAGCCEPTCGPETCDCG
jgi:hypothetical protein